MEDKSLLVDISKQTIQNPKYFVYKKKKYLVNFDLLKQNCTYFYQNQDKYLNDDNINIFDEEDEEFPLTENSINSFIKICQNEATKISLSSVIPLQYLSYKYEYPALKNITNEFITKYPQDLIFKKLLIEKKKSEKCSQNEEAFFDTSREEEYISKHLNDFIKTDKITELKIAVLLRIFQRYLNDENNAIKVNNKDMIDFLFRCLDKYGSAASILFNKIDFAEEQINVIHRLHYQYKGRFDFNFLNSTLTKTTLQLADESDRQKKEYSELFAEMKKQFEEQSEELKKMKEDEKMREIENEKKERERKEEYEKEIDKINKNFEQRLMNIEKNYEQIFNRQKNLIENSVIQKLNKIIIELMSDDAFYRLDTESQIYVVDEIVKKNEYHNIYEKENKLESIVQKIIFFNQLFQNSSIIESNKSSHELVKFILENDKILTLNNDICVNLYQKNLLAKSLLVICNSFDEFVINIEHPAKSYDEISKIIYDIINQNKNPSQQIVISDIKKQNNTFEKKLEIIQPIVTPIESNSFKGSSPLAKIVIPPSITAIESNSYKDYSSLKEIIIPTSITKICESSFEGCSSLTKIVIPLSVSTIESNSFKNCSSLKEIIIPKSITKICESSFEGCSSLTKIVIPPSVTTIESNSFKNCINLKQINISSQTLVERNSFDNCESLERLVISSSKVNENDKKKEESSIFFKSNIDSSFFNSVTEDEQETILNIIKNNQPKENKEKINNIQNLHAFLKKEMQQSKNYDKKQKNSILQIVQNDEQILIKSDMTEILNANQTLDKEEFLQHVNKFSYFFIEAKYIYKSSSLFDTIFNKLKSMKNGSVKKLKIAVFITGCDATDQRFHGDQNISYITLDKCISKIQNDGSNGSFQGCSSLTQITIPSSVISIGKHSFFSCSSLVQIAIPSSVTSIGENAFSYCSSLTQITIPSSVTSIGNSAFSKCSSLTQITIPSSVTGIGHWSFSECASLTQITIPSSVTSFGVGVLNKCKKLCNISIAPCKDKRIEYIEDKFLVFKTSPTSENYDALVFAKPTIKTATIPSFIKTIMQNALCGCSSLTQITIPSSVTKIGDSAFSECSSLTQITIPSSVTKIGDSAFSECSLLSKITFSNPSSVTSIGYFAFSECSSLKQITIPSPVTLIGIYAFRGCSSLTQIIIPSSVTTIENYVFEGCSSLTQITIPSRINRSNLKINSNATVNLI